MGYQPENIFYATLYPLWNTWLIRNDINKIKSTFSQHETEICQTGDTRDEGHPDGVMEFSVPVSVPGKTDL